MNKLILFLFGIFSYGLFLFCTVFTMGFLNNRWVPAGIDHGAVLGGDASSVLLILLAAMINVALVTLFGFSHSLFARESVKQFISSWLPKAAVRSVYVFQSSAILIGIALAWQPIPTVIWDIQHQWLSWAILTVQGIGWLTVVWATFAINHFELTGLQQVYFNLIGRAEPAPQFASPWLYRIVRHPMQTGILLAFWFTPHMTVGHLIYAATMSLYIVVGIRFEERSLVTQFGELYRDYQKQVPMLVPRVSAGAKRLSPAYAPSQPPRSDSSY